MDIYYEANRIILGSVLEVIQSIIPLEEAPEVAKSDFIRLVESPFELTDSIKRGCAAITAHNLDQYRNPYHSIRLKDDIEIDLDCLLAIDEREELLDEI